MTYALTKVLDLGLLKRKILHRLLQVAHLALLNLYSLDLDHFLSPSGLHSLLLARAENSQSCTRTLVPRCTSNPMDVGVDIVRAVMLDNPVYGREVETTSCNVGTDEKS